MAKRNLLREAPPAPVTAAGCSNAGAGEGQRLLQPAAVTPQELCIRSAADLQAAVGLTGAPTLAALTEATLRLHQHRSQVLLLIAYLFAEAKRALPVDREWLAWAQQFREYQPRQCYALAKVGKFLGEQIDQYPVLMTLDLSKLDVLASLRLPHLRLVMDVHGRALAEMTREQCRREVALLDRSGETTDVAPRAGRPSVIERLAVYRPEKLVQADEFAHLVVRGKRLLDCYVARERTWTLSADELAGLREFAQTILAVTE